MSVTVQDQLVHVDKITMGPRTEDVVDKIRSNESTTAGDHNIFGGVRSHLWEELVAEGKK